MFLVPFIIFINLHERTYSITQAKMSKSKAKTSKQEEDEEEKEEKANHGAPQKIEMDRREIKGNVSAHILFILNI